MNKKILYIEISTAHTEILNSFVDALLPEFEVCLLINEKSISRVRPLSKKIKIMPLREQFYMKDILECKKKFVPGLILLNSAQGRRIRDLCLRLLFDKTPVIGIHHNAENLFKSFTQKIIHFKVKKYIVLADFIRDFVKSKINTNRLEVESFYPVSYPQVEKIKIDSSFKYILIPGVLEQDRRDYLGLIEMVKAADARLDSKLKFVLVGNSKNHDGPAIVKAIQRAGLVSRFILFDRYVEDDILLAYVDNCLAIMPLIHPGTRWFDQYFETKISGAYTLAFAFTKPLLMDEVFTDKKEFKDYAQFYSVKNFATSISKMSSVEKDPKFEFSAQKKKLLDFIRPTS